MSAEEGGISTARKSTLLSSAAITLASQLAGLVLYFTAQRMILGSLSKEENGILFGVQRFSEFLIIILVEAGLTGLVQRYIIRRPEDENIIIGTLAKLRIGLWLVATAVLLIASYLFEPRQSMEILLWVLYLFISGKGGLLRSAFELRFRARSRFFLIQALALMDLALFLVLLLALGTWQLDARHVLELFLLASVPGFILLFILAKEWRSLFAPFSMNYARQIFADAAPIVASILLLQLNDKADTFFLAGFHSAAELGIYAAAFRVVTPFYTFAYGVSNSVGPGLVTIQKSDPERSRRYNATILKIVLMIAGLVSVVASCATGFLISLLTKGKYADSQLHFFLFLWTAIPTIVILYSLDINIALGMQKRNFLIAGLLVGMSVLANLLLTVQGASMGAVLARFVTVWAGAFIIFRIQKEMYEGGKLFYRFFALAFVMMAACYFLPQYLNFPLSIGISAIVYVFLLFVTKCISAEDLTYFRTIVARFPFIRRFLE